MAAKTNGTDENMVLGIDTASNPVKAEEDFVAGLLEAAAYKEEDESRKEIEIVRNGKKLFSFTVRPISTDEYYAARKKATKLVKNPLNKKAPMIEDEAAFSTSLFHSWLIYTATIDEDKEKIWGNPAIKQKYNLMLPVDSIPLLLRIGDVNKVVDIIMTISGLDDDDETSTVEEAVKN